MAYIETRFEAMLGAHATAEAAGHDAVVIAAFGDPGLQALREVLPMPVTGLTEAALMSACLLGQRFSIIAISTRIRAWYRECVEVHGLLGRLASIRSLARQVRDLLPVPVVDGVSSAVRHAETLAALAPVKARAGSFALPPVKPNAGLSMGIQALLARR